MANLSQLTLPVKDTITGIVTTQTFDLAGGDSKNFIGSRAEWEALTQAEKEEYDTMDIYGEYNDDPIDAVPTSGSTNAVASGGVYTALQNVETNIAGIESSATASQAYTIGKYIIFGNVLYKVIASIAQGDTLVANTNIQAAKIADEVSDHLTVNGTEFYFDSHDGVFGYNTSPNRGADTFVPFKSGDDAYYYPFAVGGSGSNIPLNRLYVCDIVTDSRKPSFTSSGSITVLHRSDRLASSVGACTAVFKASGSSNSYGMTYNGSAVGRASFAAIETTGSIDDLEFEILAQGTGRAISMSNLKKGYYFISLGAWQSTPSLSYSGMTAIFNSGGTTTYAGNTYSGQRGALLIANSDTNAISTSTCATATLIGIYRK